MESLTDRKNLYIDAIVKGHPVYVPEDVISQRAAKSLQRLPEQTLFWLFHLLPDEKKITGG